MRMHARTKLIELAEERQPLPTHVLFGVKVYLIFASRIGILILIVPNHIRLKLYRIIFVLLAMIIKKIRLCLQDLLQYSWVTISFLILCLGVLEQGLSKLQTEQVKLEASYHALLNQKAIALKNHDRLTRQINSQSDPAWIEMTLKKTLGVVPENQIKVFFDEGDFP